MCYLDMMFCPFHDTCNEGKSCGWALTEEVKDAAQEWWKPLKGVAPICMFAEIPDCWEPLEKKTTQ